MQITPLIVCSIAAMYLLVAVLRCAILRFTDSAQRYLQLTAQTLDRARARQLFAVEDLVGVAGGKIGAQVDLQVR
jgi:hypothetical protein